MRDRQDNLAFRCLGNRDAPSEPTHITSPKAIIMDKQQQ
jgi:hypothetical protein